MASRMAAHCLFPDDVQFDNALMPALIPTLRWDIFCRVIDNFGDAGVCWRLAANLAGGGDAVRLIIDDTAPLAFMAPAGCAGVQVLPWPGPAVAGDVVVEAFGCDPPAALLAEMASRREPPTWINLEYLSAESYVERSHRLPSPQRNGVTKWFFYPGFKESTGGLLREPALMAARKAFNRDAWLASRGLKLQTGERVVSLFCYDNPRVNELSVQLADQPTLLLLTAGQAQQQVGDTRPGLRLARLPWLTQTDFDHMLWASDLNFVRGEDSLVRALWAGAPMVWQLYPQDDDAHAAKLEAMLTWLQAGDEVAAFWRSWNGLRPGALPPLPALRPWCDTLTRARTKLLAQGDLAAQLRAFVTEKRQARC
jgi:uncharacterized repeat protein (TIGR03837 family)